MAEVTDRHGFPCHSRDSWERFKVAALCRVDALTPDAHGADRREHRGWRGGLVASRQPRFVPYKRLIVNGMVIWFILGCHELTSGRTYQGFAVLGLWMVVVIWSRVQK